MPLSTQEFQSWLEDSSAIRCMLVEVSVYTGTQETTLYISNRNYATNSTDTPGNQIYLPLLSTSVEFTETLPIDSVGSLSYGDLSISNSSGEYDYLLNYIWADRPINIYLGDVRHTRDKFTKIFSGVVSGITSSSLDSINIQIRDNLQRLNTSIYEITLGNYGTRGANNANKDEIRPLVFGEVSNITPLLIDEAELEFMVHDGAIERIIEVRDNGVPVGFIPNLLTGTFKLVANPVGTVTCSVQGDKYSLNQAGELVSVWPSTLAKIIQRIVTNYGKPEQAVTIDELDLDNFNAFDSLNTQKLGIYISSRDNLLSVCQSLCDSIGAQLVATRDGKLKLLKVDVPATISTSTVITEDYILQDSFQISSKLDVVSAVKLGYCFNYTIQEGVLTGIPEEHKSLYAKEWLTKVVNDTSVQQLYKLSAEPEQQNTLMLSDLSNDVTLEATRRLNIKKTQRFIYSMECVPALATISLGDMIVLKHRRFGLSNGRAGQVISVSVNWDTGYTRLEVLV